MRRQGSQVSMRVARGQVLCAQAWKHSSQRAGKKRGVAGLLLGIVKLMSIKSVMPSNHLILYHPLLLLPSVFPTGAVKGLRAQRSPSSLGHSLRSPLPHNLSPHPHGLSG